MACGHGVPGSLCSVAALPTACVHSTNKVGYLHRCLRCVYSMTLGGYCTAL